MTEIMQLKKNTPLWKALAEYAETCSWAAGKHLAALLRDAAFAPWEGVFAAISQGKIVGFCTFLERDYYPENRYSPWISSIFVDESARGHRLSGQMVEAVIDHARKMGFRRVYIPSNMLGFYEAYGFEKIDTLVNYGGEIDLIFARDI